MKFKKNIEVGLFILLGSMMMLFTSCEKEDEINLPSVKTVAISNIMYNQATVTGSIVASGNVVIIERGIVWNTEPNSSTFIYNYINETNESDDFSIDIRVKNNTTIYARAYAVTNEGRSYGEELSFTLWLDNPEAPVMDIDKNSYTTVRIGEQVWMRENLKTTRYQNGDTIANITLQEDALWLSVKYGAYCAYDDDMKNAEVYGCLYNGYAQMDNRKICPQGWHMPTKEEWQTLVDFLGQAITGDAGSRLKKTTGWDLNLNNSWDSTSNLSGFTALAGGLRWHPLNDWPSTSYSFIKSQAYFAASDESSYDPFRMWYANVASNVQAARVNSNITKTNGLSVRCVKD